MKSKKDLSAQIMQEAQKIDIPDSIQPDTMRKKLEEHILLSTGQGEEIGGAQQQQKVRKEEKKKTVLNISLNKLLPVAACLVLILGAFFLTNLRAGFSTDKAENMGTDLAAEETEKGGELSTAITVELAEELPKGPDFGEATYEEIYASMLLLWEEEKAESISFRNDEVTGGTAEPMEGMIADTTVEMAAQESASETGKSVNSGILEGNVYEAEVGVSYAENEKEMAAEDGAATEENFGMTNIQMVGVDEGDIIKNDGRYLYQIVGRAADNGLQQTIQIVDTKEGLNRVGCIGNFDNIQEFYVSDDCLVIIETKYLDYPVYAEGTVNDYYDRMYRSNAYHEISFYDIRNREEPHFIKRFTLNGEYTSSRISDGYFYGFSRFYASPGEGEADYAAYIPKVDGNYLTSSQILLPEENRGTSYLVLVSVNMDNPKEFVETKAIVSTGDLYYVSGENIYVTSFHSAPEQKGWSSTSTNILKFAYDEGEFSLEAEGTIKGQLESSFSLDEYEGYLRAVTTVQEYNYRALTDDRTGKHIGYEVLREKETNSLYVLDEELEVVGKIEDLAEDERIYSARFLGETGYFVTFRQTDPLYAVDLSDPARPGILSELKISGFSEYLHLYGTDRLLGIGMEADEETGIQEGMKLSMFDISDPGDVQEAAKLNLEHYDYSEALYNHKAVLVHAGANIIGFEAEGYNDRYMRKYLLFSYDFEKDSFIREMELDAKDINGNFCQTRGTFIGDVFYLLSSDGSITSYDRESGRKLETLEFNSGKN
ncbi:MAG: beta-propeller domain-containing protein [Lachnospiraceae bacterium]|nr:beta-propeller domain-containing protein [Lachnospiraceae bacterium]